MTGVTDIPGVRLGHWTDPVARTGCTVALLPAGTVASGEVRGGAPGTREWALLDPRRTVDEVNAVVMSGGSAFGLAACDGVVRWCAERGIGWPTTAGPVPIVVGMVLYDLTVGDPSVRPGPDEGYAACVAAMAGGDALSAGRIGAGTGATLGKWRGPSHARPAGIGSATLRHGDLTVTALAAVNAVGDLWDPAGAPRVPVAVTGLTGVTAVTAVTAAGEATTLVLVVTNGRIDKAGCRLVAEAGHDGLARALDPVHTAADGDAVVAAATGAVEAETGLVRALAATAVHQAVVAAAA